MIRRLTNCFQLLQQLRYAINIPPRPSHIPTQSDKLLPFSINHLHNNPGARRYPKKLGRGPASGKGKTSARGVKGQKSRSGGGVHVRFEGGQTPIQKRLPKYGRVVKKRAFELLDYVNLEKIDYFVKRGIINPEQTITLKTLADCGLAKKVKFGIKILARGADRITYPLHLEVSDASKTAIKYIQQQGGSVSFIYRTPLKLREHLYPEKYPLPLREPIPPFWRVQKIQRKEEQTGIEVKYRKPKWMVQEEKKRAKQKPKQIETSPFVYPVPIVQNSGKIRKRQPKIYRKINYRLP